MKMKNRKHSPPRAHNRTSERENRNVSNGEARELPESGPMALSKNAAVALAQDGASEITMIAAGETRSETAPEPQQDRLALLATELLVQRLVAARDARGWTREHIASELRLPLRIVQWIETGQHERIGQGVYLRGYLTNYARLVGVPVAAVEEWLRAAAPPPPELIATGQISRSRYFVERYSGSALYFMLTGVIFVPLLMFAMNLGGDAGSHLASLDAPAPAASEPESGAPADSTTRMNLADAKIAMAPPSVAANNDSPVMASFALASAVADPANPAKQRAAAPGEPLRLSIGETSWVEIVDADGKRLEYATLPAGTVKDYPAGKSLTILIGNTNGAKVEIDGRAQDLAPYTRGNVARFKLAAGSLSMAVAESVPEKKG